MTELAQPLVVRRKVAFAEAIYEGFQVIEDVKGVFVRSYEDAASEISQGNIAILVDPSPPTIDLIDPFAIVDARMQKKEAPANKSASARVIGLGPGFIGGLNCVAAIETNRGDNLGRIYWVGSPEPDTGIPSVVEGHGKDRVLYAQTSGIVENFVEIGDVVEKDQLIARISDSLVLAPFPGVLRGLIRHGTQVHQGVKIGDVDPRMDKSLPYKVSDKSIAVGKAVVEAVTALDHQKAIQL